MSLQLRGGRAATKYKTTVTPPVTTTFAGQSTFDALTPGQTIVLTPGTYNHSAVLNINVNNVTVDGNGATLHATTDATSALMINGDNITLKNITLTSSATARAGALEQMKLALNQCSFATVSNVTVVGSAAAGIFMFGADHYLLEYCSVSNTKSDGIHSTFGSNNGNINYCTANNTGDDGFAVVSYGNESICHDITFASPVVNGGLARGCSVVGGNNITYNNVTVSDTAAAGIYVACESSYSSFGCNTVAVNGGTLTRCSTGASQGAICVPIDIAGKTITGVNLNNLAVNNTPAVASRGVALLRYSGTLNGVTLTNITLTDTSGISSLDKVGSPGYTATGCTHNGTAFS